MELKPESVGYHTLRPDVRKSGGRGVAYISRVKTAEEETGDETIDTKLSEKLYTRERQQLSRALNQQIVSMIKHEKIKTRNFSGYLSTDAISDTLATFVVIPYMTNIHFHGNRYRLAGHRFYSLLEGLYDVKATLGLVKDTGDDFVNTQIAVFLNGAEYKTLDIVYVAGARIFIGGSCLVYMECGEYIDIRFKNPCPATQTRATANCYGYLDIHYSGCNAEKTGNYPLLLTY